ncbi:MAG TPA: hypothetical protein VFV72_06355 [Candidatus Limnocylindrales bacterium]|nr:hypothetical protein [Candidatus Limnocylindrales bacterium]
MVRDVGELIMIGLTFVAAVVGFLAALVAIGALLALYGLAGNPEALSAAVGLITIVGGLGIWVLVTVWVYRIFRRRVPRAWYESPPDEPTPAAVRRPWDEVLTDVRLADTRLAAPRSNAEPPDRTDDELDRR